MVKLDKIKLQHNIAQLERYLKQYKKIAIASSGGIDSSTLLKCAADTLGNKNVLAVFVKTFLIPEEELISIKAFAGKLSVKLEVINKDITRQAEITGNRKDRCYRCKKQVFAEIINKASALGFETVADGSNYDDIAIYRPGLKALGELGVISPFKELGISKEIIRHIAKQKNISFWDKPSNPCLATRVPYNYRLSEETIKRIHDAEYILRRAGLKNLRVRHHGNLARIEVSQEDFDKILEAGLKAAIIDGFKKLGYKFITLDIEGFRSGSFD